MINNGITRVKYLEYNFISRLILIVFGFVFVFASQDPNLGDQHEHTKLFYEIFLQGLGHKHFSFLQLLLVLISFIIYFYHWTNKKHNNYQREKKIIALTLFYVIFLLINPNNRVLTPLLGLPLLSDPDLYVYFLLMIMVFLIGSDEDFIVFLRNLVKIIITFFIIRVFYLLILWILGNGVYYFGEQSVTMEEDTLLLAVFVQVILLALYYLKKERKYLFFVMIFQLLQILSFRRSGFLLSLLVIGTYFVVFYSKYNKAKRVFVFLLLAFSLFITSLNLNLLPSSALFLLNRYVGAFIDVPGAEYLTDIVRNDHLDQSNESFLDASSHLGFWGFGYGDTYRRLSSNYKGNTGIHNVYHNLWEWQGLYALLYYLILIIIFFKEVRITIKDYKNLDIEYLYFRMAVIIFFSFYLINAYVLMMANFTGIKMRIVWVLVLAFLIKVKPNNYKLLFENGKQIKIGL